MLRLAAQTPRRPRPLSSNVRRRNIKSESSVPWYAIRTVYHFGTKTDGTNVFEERIVCFNAQSWEEAHQRAEAESERYEVSNNAVAHPEQIGYEQDGKSLADEYELWSELFESKATLEAFYAERYENYEYQPESPKS